MASRLVGEPLRLLATLAGGEHARTILVASDIAEYVVRGFPAGDPAVVREVEVLARLSDLGDLVPHLIGASDDPGCPVIVTSRVPGIHPPIDLPAEAIATEMAAALARVHRLAGDGLRVEPSAPPGGQGPAAVAARTRWASLDLDDRVLTHYDFWCGNALWTGDRLTGVVDWSGARCAPRGVDVAWCRLDLVLLGSETAADLFLRTYERLSGRSLDVTAWDLLAAATAEGCVEEWSPNYVAIGRTDLTPVVLRERLVAWVGRLVAGSGAA